MIPGTALYAAAVLSLAAVISLVKAAAGRLNFATFARTEAGRVLAYFPFVTLLKMAVAMAPKSNLVVPARPAAVPLHYVVSNNVVCIDLEIIHIILAQNSKSDDNQAVENDKTCTARNNACQDYRLDWIIKGGS